MEKSQGLCLKTKVLNKYIIYIYNVISTEQKSMHVHTEYVNSGFLLVTRLGVVFLLYNFHKFPRFSTLFYITFKIKNFVSKNK